MTIPPSLAYTVETPAVSVTTTSRNLAALHMTSFTSLALSGLFQWEITSRFFAVSPASRRAISHMRFSALVIPLA